MPLSRFRRLFEIVPDRHCRIFSILWGAPPIRAELRLLGYPLASSTIAKYMDRTHQPPSQTWRSFLKNHVDGIVSVDFFTVPTALFQVLFVFVVLRHRRRRVVHFNVTAHPSSAWVAQQLREAFPFDQAPRHLIRDGDGSYGDVFRRCLRSLGIQRKCSLLLKVPGRIHSSNT